MSSGRLARLAERVWYGPRAPLALRPLAWMFGCALRLRRAAWEHGLRRPRHAGVPVIVVGNITVGGTGKTPVVAWLAMTLSAAGYRPGIVSRGYGGSLRRGTHLVSPGDPASLTGDEPLLLRRTTGLPVCIGRDRAAAAARLANEAGVDIIIADDGLQHLGLVRDLEIAVLDGERMLGNGMLLPAGPLREPASRLAGVDFVLVNGGTVVPAGAHRVQVRSARLLSPDGSRREPLAMLAGQRARVLAGIGNPARVYHQLEAAGIEVLPLPAGDHGRVSEAVLAEDPGLPLLMTGKDAVKYRLPPVGCTWVLEAALDVPPALREAMLDRVAAIAGPPRARRPGAAQG